MGITSAAVSSNKKTASRKTLQESTKYESSTEIL